MLNADAFTKTKTYLAIKEGLTKDPYQNTVFKDLKNLSSKKKGKHFEALYQEYAERLGQTVKREENSDHDSITFITRTKSKKEIKGSFLWGEGTHFRWQQIRPDQDYDDVVFLAVYPDRVEFYEANKETVRAAVEVQDEKGNWIYNQHGGKTVNSGAFFLDGFPQEFPWMKTYDTQSGLSTVS